MHAKSPTFRPAKLKGFTVYKSTFFTLSVLSTGSRDSHMALWRVVDDDDDVMSASVAGCQSYTHWTAGLHASSDDDDDDYDEDETSGRLTWHSDSEPAMKRLAATAPHRRRDRPLHVPSYYRMKPVSVKLCEKAEKVRAFAYNDVRQVITSSRLCSSLSPRQMWLHIFCGIVI